jgi:hypothetical protein
MTSSRVYDLAGIHGGKFRGPATQGCLRAGCCDREARLQGLLQCKETVGEPEPAGRSEQLLSSYG